MSNSNVCLFPCFSERRIFKTQMVPHVSNEKKSTWLFRGFVEDEILPSYVGIILNHYKDP